MQIEAKSYEHMLYGKEAEYIHRFYLPKSVRESVQVQDVHTFELNVTGDDTLVVEKLVIYYQKEKLIKTIQPLLVTALFTAHQAYKKDCSDRTLSKEETCFLIVLNEKLKQLEIDVMVQMEECRHRLESELEQGVFVKDYEMEVVFNFYLAENEPDYDEDDDNILYQTTTWFAPLPETVGENQNQHSDSPDISKVHHCQLFHDLKDHSPLPLKHLCRIGTIWTDISTIRQNTMTVKHR